MESFHAFTADQEACCGNRACAQIYGLYIHTMSNAAAKSLRNQINLLASELRAAEATETRAEIRNRKLRILELERQLTEG